MFETLDTLELSFKSQVTLSYYTWTSYMDVDRKGTLGLFFSCARRLLSVAAVHWVMQSTNGSSFNLPNLPGNLLFLRARVELNVISDNTSSIHLLTCAGDRFCPVGILHRCPSFEFLDTKNFQFNLMYQSQTLHVLIFVIQHRNNPAMNPMEL